MVNLFGNFTAGTKDTFAGAASTYVSGSGTNQVVDLDGYSEALCYADVDVGSGTDVRVRFEFSPDNAVWAQEDVENLATAGQINRVQVFHRFVATAKHPFAVPKLARYMRAKATYTGTSTTSALGLAIVASIR